MSASTTLAPCPVQIASIDKGPQIVIKHPNPSSPLALVIDAYGYRCRTAPGCETAFTLPVFVRHLAEWFRGRHGIICGHSNSPETYAATGITDTATINRPGQLEHIHISNHAVLHNRPNAAGQGDLYLHTRLVRSGELAALLAEWFSPETSHPTLKGE